MNHPLHRPLVRSILAAAAVLALVPAHAEDNTVKVGFAHIQVNDRTTGLSGIGVPPGATLDVRNSNTLLLTYERRLLPNVGVELAIGIPPSNDVDTAGSIAFLGKAAEVKQAAPTAFVNYHFFDEGDALRPFVGVGINFTHFYDAKSFLGQNIQLTNSVGPAAHFGVDYRVSGGWSVFTSLVWAKVKSDLVATGTTVQRTTIDFRPIVFSVGVGYSF